uniref:Uncharacterized protein n=1 Tax=Anguilla anguilla TaxID=7936 RepID=A0A0E9X549_ANGAN
MAASIFTKFHVNRSSVSTVVTYLQQKKQAKKSQKGSYKYSSSGMFYPFIAIYPNRAATFFTLLHVTNMGWKKVEMQYGKKQTTALSFK